MTARENGTLTAICVITRQKRSEGIVPTYATIREIMALICPGNAREIEESVGELEAAGLVRRGRTLNWDYVEALVEPEDWQKEAGAIGNGQDSRVIGELVR